MLSQVPFHYSSQLSDTPVTSQLTMFWGMQDIIPLSLTSTWHVTALRLTFQTKPPLLPNIETSGLPGNTTIVSCPCKLIVWIHYNVYTMATKRKWNDLSLAQKLEIIKLSTNKVPQTEPLTLTSREAYIALKKVRSYFEQNNPDLTEYYAIEKILQAAMARKAKQINITGFLMCL